jgi:hypothetical protein
MQNTIIIDGLTFTRNSKIVYEYGIGAREIGQKSKLHFIAAWAKTEEEAQKKAKAAEKKYKDVLILETEALKEYKRIFGDS